MALKEREIQSLCACLQQELTGQYLAKAVQFDEDVFSFSLSKSGRLVFVLFGEDPYVYLSSAPLDVVSLSSPLATMFRKELSHAQILDVSQVNHDRIIAFRLRSVNDLFQEVERTLILELIPHHPNLLLLDENGRILGAKKVSSLTDARPILKGIVYEPPKALPEQKDAQNAFDYSQYLLSCAEKEAKLDERRKATRFHALFRQIKTKQKAAKRKIAAIESDIAKAETHLGDGEYGSYIYTCLEDIHPETGSMDYYGQAIPLDPRRSAVKNAEAFFQRAKKAKATVANGNKNLLLAIEEGERWDRLAAMLELSDEGMLEKLAKEYGLEAHDAEQVKKSPLSDSATLPYFVTIDGVTYLFGKNAVQNDFLSFLYATKKTNLWFHVKDHRGAHLILQKDDPSKEEISNACELVLLASGLDGGEVQYAEHRFIRRGSVKGQVILKTYQSAYFKAIRPEIQAAFARAEKIHVKGR